MKCAKDGEISNHEANSVSHIHLFRTGFATRVESSSDHHPLLRSGFEYIVPQRKVPRATKCFRDRHELRPENTVPDQRLFNLHKDSNETQIMSTDGFLQPFATPQAHTSNNVYFLTDDKINVFGTPLTQHQYTSPHNKLLAPLSKLNLNSTNDILNSVEEKENNKTSQRSAKEHPSFPDKHTETPNNKQQTTMAPLSADLKQEKLHEIHFTSPEANTPTIVRDLMALMETCGVFSPHYLACDISLLQNIYYRSATVAPDGKPLRILTVGPRGCGDSDIVLPLLVRIALMRYAIGPREACPLFVPLPWANLVPNDHCNACEFSENFLRGVFQALSIQVPSTAPHTSASLFGFWNHLADMGCGEEVEDAPIVPSIVPELLRPRWLSLLRNLRRSLHVDGDFKRFVSDLFLVPVLISKSFGLSGVCFVQSNFSTTARDIEIRSSSQDTHSTSTFRFAEALFPSIFPRKYRNSVHFIACWDDNGPSLSEEAEKAVETTGKLSMVPSVSNQEELASFVQFARPRILAMRHLVQGVETSIPERIVVPSHSDFTVCLADCHGYPSAVHLYFELFMILSGSVSNENAKYGNLLLSLCIRGLNSLLHRFAAYKILSCDCMCAVQLLGYRKYDQSNVYTYQGPEGRRKVRSVCFRSAVNEDDYHTANDNDADCVIDSYMNADSYRISSPMKKPRIPFHYYDRNENEDGFVNPIKFISLEELASRGNSVRGDSFSPAVSCSVEPRSVSPEEATIIV